MNPLLALMGMGVIRCHGRGCSAVIQNPSGGGTVYPRSIERNTGWIQVGCSNIGGMPGFSGLCTTCQGSQNVQNAHRGRQQQQHGPTSVAFFDFDESVPIQRQQQQHGPTSVDFFDFDESVPIPPTIPPRRFYQADEDYHPAAAEMDDEALQAVLQESREVAERELTPPPIEDEALEAAIQESREIAERLAAIQREPHVPLVAPVLREPSPIEQGRLVLQQATDITNPIELPFEYLAHGTQNFRNPPIGEGAFGKVYRFVDNETNPPIIAAVKRLNANIDTVGRDRSVQREIESLTMFKHPNIIRLLGYATPLTGERCLLYEYASGGSLADILSTRPADLDWRDRIRIATGVTKALNYLQRRVDGQGQLGSCFHRDVKAANIVLTSTMQPKLIDCGLAMLLPNTDAQRGAYTVTGGILGTIGYMCPVYRNSGKYGESSEIYSMGIVWLELLTGKLQNQQRSLALVVREDEEILEAMSNENSHAGEWPRDVQLSELVKLARDCIKIAGDSESCTTTGRIPTLRIVLNQFMGLERRFCQTNNEDRLLEELRREREIAHRQNVLVEARLMRCDTCFDEVDSKLMAGCQECANAGRNSFLCHESCFSPHVNAQLDLADAEDSNADCLANHRQRGGRIRCVNFSSGCPSLYTDQQIAIGVNAACYERYRSLQEAGIEQRIFQHAQTRIETEVRAVEVRLRAEIEAGRVEEAIARGQAEREATQLKQNLARQFPNARQCGRCGLGPVDFAGCNNLNTHHGQGLTDNACKQCGWRANTIQEWPRWNGVIAPEVAAAVRTSNNARAPARARAPAPDDVRPPDAIRRERLIGLQAQGIGGGRGRGGGGGRHDLTATDQNAIHELYESEILNHTYNEEQVRDAYLASNRDIHATVNLLLDRGYE